jgi:AraC family transcriptional regulator, regulatory protein of adaptative response / DNA-3-methyladenine glycosylase II
MASHPIDPVSSRDVLNPEVAYRAWLAHDSRFDGQVFMGVTSTRIYCRPVCRVRMPLAKHCRFFAHAALAECAGFRPCKRCRPELAPGLSRVDAPKTLAHQAAQMLERAVLEGHTWTMPSLAAKLGVTDRHLRRIFVQSLGVSPIDYNTTQRLLFAKRLITDTRMPMADVAFHSGFQSVRRFNAVFAAKYRMTPGDLRESAAKQKPAASGVDLRLGYRGPYDVAGVMAFLHERALPKIEHVDTLRMRLVRTLRMTHHGKRFDGWVGLQFEPKACEVRLTLSDSLVPALGAMMARARRALDLDAQPDAVTQGLKGLPVPIPAGLRIVGSLDPWESLVRIVLGQQVSVAAAKTLASRLVMALGTPLAASAGAPADAPWSSPPLLFPDAATLATATPDDLGRLGIVRTRIAALQALARAVVDGSLDLEGRDDIASTMDKLQSLPGVGPWTAQLVALRVLGWPDAFAPSDLGVLRALGTNKPSVALGLSQAWAPWRGYALMALWQSRSTGT